MNPLDKIRLGLRDVLPVVLAYFPLAAAFGVLASASGMPAHYNFLTSAWIYSGGAQFMLLSLLGDAISPFTIISTLLLVNMRHIMYGTSIGPHVRGWSEPYKWLGAFGLTDEVFAVVSSRLDKNERLSVPYFITVMLAAYGSWLTGTLAGYGLGTLIPSGMAEILGFALPALFIALLFGSERSRADWTAALCGALLATLAALWNAGGIGIVLGGLLGAAVAMKVRPKKREHS
ncbi:AzlC family ABC transporter permease [Paenibacillus apis]|uniref:Branched-chain amino acid ABC transporter permease n=1 Tax=Paenibacillus apis TaxID=1792174 RepID=A0A920CMQ3_9BACL|nr:AzlC family ABC transporter permease [Paenibacillus apis]GIO42327.1 hypothetical protein J41TS4_20850 [Paenibacillus apis]